MEKMIIADFKIKKSKDSARIMSEEFTPADIKQIFPKMPTLKALEAYKRLELIKKQNNQDISLNVSVDSNKYETSPM